MTASEAPLAGVRVDRRVMRLAALFVQPDGCYAGLPVKCCANSLYSVQSFNATQRPKSSKGISSRISRSKPRESALADCAMAERQSRTGCGIISKMGKGKPGEGRRETTRVAREEQGEASTNATRMAGTCWLQPAPEGSGRPCSAAAKEVWLDRGIIYGASEFSRWLLRDMRSTRSRHEERFQALRRSLPRNRASQGVAVQIVQHHAGKRQRYVGSIACWGGLS